MVLDKLVTADTKNFSEQANMLIFRLVTVA